MNEGPESYFAEAAAWELDSSATAAASTRRAWLVAGFAVALAVMSCGAVLLLTPLKTSEAFLVRVDTSTGIVDVVPRYAGTAELPEIVTRHLVSEYVTQRERYIPAIAESDYDQIGAFHSAAMNVAWASLWQRTNPDSPLVRYADGSHVRAQIQSISFLRRTGSQPELVQVRFITALQRGAGGAEELRHYIATMQVAFSRPSEDMRLRALNPLGFKVLEYRRESEASADVAAAAANAGGAS